MAVTAVTIASRAMNMIGGNEISSFSETSNEAKVANNLYVPLIEAALTLHRWRFATGQSLMSRLVAAPAARWDAAYQIPTNPKVLMIHGITIIDMPIQYDRYEATLGPMIWFISTLPITPQRLIGRHTLSKPFSLNWRRCSPAHWRARATSHCSTRKGH